MKLTVPTALTLFRIILIPVFIIVFYWPSSWANIAATIIYSLAAITDWFDGYLARVLNQESAFGAFLDPVADKLMVVAAIVLLVEVNPSPFLAIPSIIIISREISVSALREWMSELGNSATIKVNFVGKAKTTFQLISIIFMIYHDDLFGFPIYQVGLGLFYLAALLTLYSMVVYLKAAWPIIVRHG